MQGTRLVVTVRGYIGLADVVVQKDDLCGIIFGRNIPCVLRQVPDSNYYSFIGSAYLMGKKSYEIEEGIVVFCDPLGHEDSKDWVEWDVERTRYLPTLRLEDPVTFLQDRCRSRSFGILYESNDDWENPVWRLANYLGGLGCRSYLFNLFMSLARFDLSTNRK